MLERIYEYWRIFADLVNRYVIGVIAEMKFVDFVDIVILSIILFYVYKFIRQRRAVRLARGVLIVMAVLFISMIFNMRALNFILENFFQKFLQIPRLWNHMRQQRRHMTSEQIS